MDPDNADTYLQLTKDLVTQVCALGREAKSTNGSLDDNYPFHLSEVMFYPWERPVTRAIVDFVESAVSQPQLCIAELSLELAACDPQVSTRLLRLITGFSRLSATQVRAVMVTSSSLESFVGLCSALVDSNSIPRLQLYSAFNDPLTANRLEKWRWLGYALFRPVSRSSIRELYIDEDALSVADVGAIKDGIASERTAQALGAEGMEEIDGIYEEADVARFVQLTPDAEIRVGSRQGDAYPLSKSHVSPDDRLRVVKEDTGTEWLQILFPGSGLAWARCSDVADVEVASARRDCQSNITSLPLAFDYCEPDALPMLLRLIGAPLKSLHIDMKDSNLISGSDVKAILQACPELRFSTYTERVSEAWAYLRMLTREAGVVFLLCL